MAKKHAYIEVNKPFRIKTFSGTNAKGDWCILKCPQEKWQDEVTLFCEGFSARDGDPVQITKINSFWYSKRQGKDGRWYTNYNAEVELERVSEDLIKDNVDVELGGLDDDGELPF